MQPQSQPQPQPQPETALTDVATVPQRFVARLIDNLILVVPMLAAIAITGVDTLFGLVLVMLVVGALYEIPQLAARGATIGKRVMHLRVVAVHHGGNPSAGQAFVRVVAPNIFTASPLAALQDVGGLWGLAVYLPVFFDPWRRGLHDRLAGTRVVREGAPVA